MAFITEDQLKEMIRNELQLFFHKTQHNRLAGKYDPLWQEAYAELQELITNKTYFPHDPARIRDMILMYKEGATLREIANEFGVTYQHVNQTFKRAGVPAESGGVNVKPKMSDFTCMADGCERKAKTSGYCVTHYQRVRIHGTPTPIFKKEFQEHDDICLVNGCEEPFKSNGLCNKHATAFYLNKRKGNVSDLNDFLKVQKAKEMMGKRYALFEDIRKFMEEHEEEFSDDLWQSRKEQ
ncbi:hypothetical protein QYF50_18940 [Paenibacillus vini]|uniref:hypothetical protein n=1 Tax=Paenibacillus vini TaxID=1476024 RepID=UPI0025B63794|nr:hypothetical protein [Paenibacillus vini]MDN4069983.1 hypothetical protein [Paenibacillus vini]